MTAPNPPAPQSALRRTLELMRDRDDQNGSLPGYYRELIDAALSAPSAPGDTSAAKALPTQAEIDEMVRRLRTDRYYNAEAASMLEALGKDAHSMRCRISDLAIELNLARAKVSDKEQLENMLKDARRILADLHHTIDALLAGSKP